MKLVGLSGGIGSGKSTVARIFHSFGIPIYDSDKRAKALYFENEVKAQITKLLGEKAYVGIDAIDKEWIANIVFQEPDKLQKLNAIIHPAVAKDFIKWTQNYLNEEIPYCIKEAAILIESGAYKELDAIISVEAPEDLRISRVLERDHISIDQIKSRMQKQLPDLERRAYADYIIVNDGKRALIPQVLEIHRSLMLLSSK
jgi:dephospho-CoA kinase